MEAFNMTLDDSESEDDISLTSSVEPDQEDDVYDVEGIVAEGFVDGEKKYLVHWTGYPIAEWTWEPDSNLHDDLRTKWEDEKKAHARGEKERFDVQTFNDAVEAALRAKEQRHRRRNEKRKRLGLPLTSPELSPIAESRSSSEEAVEDNLESIAAHDISFAASSKPKPRQKIFSGIPTSVKKKGIAQKVNINSPTARAATARQTKEPVRNTGLFPKPSAQPETTSRYQGTATKPAATQPASKASTTAQQPLETASKTITRENKPKPSQTLPSAPNRKEVTTKMTARKSAPVSNVFIDGKRRKAKKTLGETMADTTKKPQLFQNYRILNQAYLKGRSKEDLGPGTADLKGQLFEISKGPETVSSREKQQPLPPANRTGHEDNQLAESGTNVSRKSSTAKKVKKSVSFALVGDSEAGAMGTTAPGAHIEEEPSMFVEAAGAPGTQNTLTGEQNEYRSPLFGSPDAMEGLNEESTTQKVQGIQDVRKSVVLGKPGGKKLDVIFTGILQDETADWSTSFMRADCMRFEYRVFADTFVEQISGVEPKRLCSGMITSDEHAALVQAVSGRLTTERSGLYISCRSYNVLLHPISSSWNCSLLGESLPDSDVPPLGYTIFSSIIDCGPFLRPPGPTEGMDSVVNTRRTLMKRMTGLGAQEYLQMLPGQGDKAQVAATIYLAFPPSQAGLMGHVASWLNSCDPRSQLLTALDTGSWVGLGEISKKAPVVVIVHSTFLGAIRRFPNFTHLDGTQNRIYSWSESSLPPPQLGQVNLTPLFPHGTAVLVTPSFILSEPRRAYELFSWFIYKIKKTEQAPFKFVTAWKVRDYLEELAMERIALRDKALKSPRPEQASSLHARCLELEDCEASLKAWILVADKTRQHEIADPLSIYGDDSYSVYAEECIDPNDEQSLVNWFGYWSMLRMDKYRHFHVVGSSTRIRKDRNGRARRNVLIPTYTKTTSSDPDEVLEDSNVQDGSVPDISPTDAPSPVEIVRSQRSNLPSTTMLFSRHASRDMHRAIRTYLMSVDEKIFKWKTWRVWRHSVRWYDTNNMTAYGVLNPEHGMIEDWFNFTLPFSYEHHFNTYIGFFWPIVDGFKPEDVPPGGSPPRHPWLLIWRPANVHRPQWTETELIIWDLTARSKFGGVREVLEEELTLFQRRAIAHVRQHSKLRQNGMEMTQVWLGSFHAPPERSGYDLDDTLVFLKDHLTLDLKQNIPSVLQPSHGYKPVVRRRVLSEPTAPTGADAKMAGTQTAGGSEGEQGAGQGPPPEKIIFHPPKARLGPAGAPKRRNRLHETARQARMRDPQARRMEYEYRPTTDWYEEQRADGRGYEHVSVMAWEEFFDRFSIADELQNRRASRPHNAG